MLTLLRPVGGPEPTRSRTLLVVTGSLSAVLVAVLVGTRGWRSSWFPASMWSLLVCLVALAVAALVAPAWVRRRPGPGRFQLRGDAFAVTPALAPGINASFQLLVLALLASEVVMMWRRTRPGQPGPDTVLAGVLTALTVLFAVLVAAVVRAAWRGFTLELSTAGVHWREPLGHRLVPWDALAAGGPLRMSPGANRLPLVVTRPELVVQRGWLPARGTRAYPTIELPVRMHPGLLADAIRWYVEHPADRADIGTEAGHDRLLTQLGADPYGTIPT